MVNIDDLNLSCEQFARFIECFPEFTLRCIGRCLTHPKVMKIMMKNSTFVDMLPLIRERYISHKIYFNSEQYTDKDSSLNQDNFDILAEMLNIYEDVDICKHTIIRSSSGVFMKKLLEININLNKDPEIFYAVLKQGDSELIKRIINENQQLVNRLDENGMHPLILILHRSDNELPDKFEIVEHILDLLYEIPEITSNFDIFRHCVQNRDFLVKLLTKYKIRFSDDQALYNYQDLLIYFTNAERATLDDFLLIIEKTNAEINKFRIHSLECLEIYNENYRDILNYLFDFDIIPEHVNHHELDSPYFESLPDFYDDEELCLKITKKILFHPNFQLKEQYIISLPFFDQEVIDYIESNLSSDKIYDMKLVPGRNIFFKLRDDN